MKNRPGKESTLPTRKHSNPNLGFWQCKNAPEWAAAHLDKATKSKRWIK
jgi:hypothetical protein